MSAGLIGYSRSAAQANSVPGQPKKQQQWTSFGKVRDFEKNSIPHDSLPIAQTYADDESYGKPTEFSECRLWSSDWNGQITGEGEAFLEEAACLGYTEDQSLAVMYVSKFDVRMARDRLMKFRNIHIPVLSPADQQIFQDLMSSGVGKKFSSYRHKLGHVKVKELVNYYYFQKQMGKRKRYTTSTLSRAALEVARERLTPEYLKEIRFSVFLRNSGAFYNCSVCFKSSNDTYKAGSDHLFCPTCYTYYQKHKRLPPLVPVEPVILPYTTPEGLAERAGSRGQENCTMMANSAHVALLREHRRQAQKLSKVKRAGPSAADMAYLMDQIDSILTQENQIRVQCLASDVIVIE